MTGTRKQLLTTSSLSTVKHKFPLLFCVTEALLSNGRQILMKSDLTAYPKHPQNTLLKEGVITTVPSHYCVFMLSLAS